MAPPATPTELQEENLRLQAELRRLQGLLADEERLHHDLADTEARYRNLVELAVDAIFMGDPQGNIIGANQSAVTLTGYSLQELLGMNLGRLFSAEEHARAPLRYDLLKAGRIVQTERMLTRKDGNTVAIGMNSRMMPDGTYHTFMRDETIRKATEDRMRALIQDLEAFTSTVSHDLRTPLTTILVSAEMLRTREQDAGDPKSRQLLALIENSAEDMLALVENLLALARAEQIRRPDEPVDGNAVLDKVLADLAGRIETVGVRVQATPLPPMHVPVTFISQIFHNLIGNALTYAGKPGGLIEVGGERQGRSLRLFVRDHGPGLPAGERERAFEVFYRGSNVGARAGSGVGLAIIARIARGFDGRAWMEESPGGGCTVCVELRDVTQG